MRSASWRTPAQFVRVSVPSHQYDTISREPWAVLGQDFRLDSEIIERLIPIDGLANVVLSAKSDRHLRLVE